MFRCGGKPFGLSVAQLLATDLSCHVSQLSLHEEGTTAVKIHRRDRQIQISKNLTGEIQLACWFVISCCIMFIWCYIYIYNYIYVYLNVVDWYFHSGKALPLFIGWPNRIEMKNVFPARVKIVPRVPCVATGLHDHVFEILWVCEDLAFASHADFGCGHHWV